jgi:hypothetical protein
LSECLLVTISIFTFKQRSRRPKGGNMKWNLLVSGILLCTAIPGTADALLLRDPLVELAWRERRLDEMVHELAVVNSYLRDLKSQVDGVMKRVATMANDTRYLDELLLPECLKRLETTPNH